LLRYRLLSAFIIISCALVFVALDAWFPLANCDGIWMLPLGGYLIYGSAIECAWMTRSSSFGSIAWPGLIGCAGVMLAACVPVLWPLFSAGEAYPADCLLGRLGWPLAASVLAIVGSFMWMVPRYAPNSGCFERAILAGWVSIYFGCCFAFAVALRMIGTPAWGLYVLVGMIVVTKFADAGAYFTGRAIGKNKLCPNVSPGKTVEGLLGGMLTACIAAWIYYKICAPWGFGAAQVTVHWLGVLALGTLLTLAGVAGDLLESIFKREMGCKDSGKLLPGLGGLWDVTDSLLPSAVVGYLVMITGLIAGPN
jgi:phosphatidate cytidylyltransferase